MRTSLALRATVSVAVLAIALTGCSNESQMRAEDPAAAGAASGDAVVDAPGDGMPTAIPAATGPVATAGLVTVLDDGDGPELCHAVAESLPPQCSGPKITGWDWAANEMHEEQSGVRWGSFHLTGTFDGTSFAVTEAIPAALYDSIAMPEEEPLGTPCGPDSAALVDETRTSPESLDATLQAAATLPGYAMAWLDREIVNVAVTEDVQGAEAKLRETWGGGLCVSEAEHTEAEMQQVQAELNALPGMLSSGSSEPDHLEVSVLFDDGSIQEWVDATYGEGLVTVSSALVPVSAG